MISPIVNLGHSHPVQHVEGSGVCELSDFSHWIFSPEQPSHGFHMKFYVALDLLKVVVSFLPSEEHRVELMELAQAKQGVSGPSCSEAPASPSSLYGLVLFLEDCNLQVVEEVGDFSSAFFPINGDFPHLSIRSCRS